MTVGRTAKIGIFIALGIASILFVIAFLGRSRAIFQEKAELYAHFTNISGLVVGAPVRLAGIDIGTVESIELSQQEGKKPDVIVKLAVDGEYLPRIRRDSIAQMSSMGLLGDMLINISLGSSSAPQLQDGDTLTTRDVGGIAEIVSTVETTMTHVKELTEVLDTRLESVLTATLARDVGRIMRSTANIAESIERGPGLAHAVIYDREMSESAKATLADARATARKLDRSLAHVEKIIGQVEHGDGLVHGLIYGEGGTQTVAEMRAALGELDSMLKEIREGKGLLHTLIWEDDETNLLENLTEASKLVRQMVEDIDQGKGTIGGFVKDPSIYREVKGILGEIRRNVLLKALVRLTIKRDGLERQEIVKVPPNREEQEKKRLEEDGEDERAEVLREEAR